MNSFNLHSHKTQLVLAAITATLATAGLISAYQTYSRRLRRLELDEEVLRAVAKAQNPSKLAAAEFRDRAFVQALDARDVTTQSTKQESDFDYEEDLIREQLARNYAIFGEEGMARVRGGSVVVVGCGGVGSWAAVMLVRSGIKRIRLVDFDYVTLSSLNRHATAMLTDVGTPKVICIERTLRQISKWVEVDSRIEMWSKEDGAALFEGVDWVVDAIDNIGTKVDLLQYSHANNLKIFSSMGAGAKFDPTRIQICDISNTIYDPLARAVRMELRKRGISHGIPVVYSTEVPERKLLPLSEEEVKKGKVEELAVYSGFRVRILPVLGPLPAVFGLHIATYVVCELAGKPLANPLAIKNRRRLYEKIWRDLASREAKTSNGATIKMPLDEDDAALIFEDVHRGRSVVPPHPVLSNPKLSRWDFSEPLSLTNCVVFDAPELKKHVEGWEKGMRPEDVWGDEVVHVVERRRAELMAWAGGVL